VAVLHILFARASAGRSEDGLRGGSAGLGLNLEDPPNLRRLALNASGPRSPREFAGDDSRRGVDLLDQLRAIKGHIARLQRVEASGGPRSAVNDPLAGGYGRLFARIIVDDLGEQHLEVLGLLVPGHGFPELDRLRATIAGLNRGGHLEKSGLPIQGSKVVQRASPREGGISRLAINVEPRGCDPLKLRGKSNYLSKSKARGNAYNKECGGSKTIHSDTMPSSLQKQEK